MNWPSDTQNPEDILLEIEEDCIQAEVLENMLSTLPSNWRYCLERIYGHEETVRSVTEKLRVSSTSVYKWTQTAIWRLSGREIGKFVMKEKSTGGRGRQTKSVTGC